MPSSSSLRARLRRLLAGLAAAAIALPLAACGTPTGEAVPTADGPVAMRTIVDIEGTEVEVPVDPQRVVTLSEPALDGALALGVTPVGTVTGRGQSAVAHYLSEQAADIPLLGGVAQPNFEEIGKARPDLILVDGTSINNNPPVIEVLRTIAPTAYVGYAGGNWRDTFGYVADALNRAEQGAQILADYDDYVAGYREDLAAYSDKTFSIVRWQGSSAALILLDLPPGRALSDLGLKRPANQDRRGRGHSEPVSLENLSDIDADFMFFGTLGGSSVDNREAGGSAGLDGAENALAEAVETPGFTELDAYKNDGVILVDGSLWTSTGGPLLMRGIVDAVAEALLDDDGQPSRS